MNIAGLKGDKTLTALATRLLAKQAKGTTKITRAELESELIRLNPQLGTIAELPVGTPVIVPPHFVLSPAESASPLRGMTEALLQQTEKDLTKLRASLDEHTTEAAAQTDRVKVWLASDQARELIRSNSSLREVFSAAGAAVKSLPKEQESAKAEQAKALDRVAASLAEFRARAATF
jgi:hypothetical protein